MRKKKGFTLVELLVTMAIIGVILGLALFGIAAAQRNARDTSRKAAVQDFNAAIQDFYTIFTAYPDVISFDTNGRVEFKTNSSSCVTTGTSRNCVLLTVQDAATPSGSQSITGADSTGSFVMSDTGTTTGTTSWCYAARSDGYSIGVILESDQRFYASTSTQEECFSTTP